MDVSIIFVNYKTKELTKNAINSVLEKTEGIEYEIFVVDNASNDGSIEAIEQEFPNINIIKSEINGGFGYANNLAIKQSKGKYIFCLNTDTLLVNNAIKIMFDFMENNENETVGVCGGQLYDIQNNKQACVGQCPTIISLLFRPFRNIKTFALKHDFSINPKFYSQNMEVTNIHGANLFLRKTVIEQIGVFDERFFMCHEDTDLCKRIKDAGYKAKFVENAKIIHLEGMSTKIKIKRQQQYIKSLFIYFEKHYPNKLHSLKILCLVKYFFNFLCINRENGKEMFKYVLTI